MGSINNYEHSTQKAKTHSCIECIFSVNAIALTERFDDDWQR